MTQEEIELRRLAIHGGNDFLEACTSETLLALLAKLERYEKALKPFADVADKLKHMDYIPDEQYPGSYVTYGDLRQVRAALEST